MLTFSQLHGFMDNFVVWENEEEDGLMQGPVSKRLIYGHPYSIPE